jgi:dGTPase
MRKGNRGASWKSWDLRSEFEKDYHRIIGSASFRRLQDKTQVFPLDQSDFIRTRLTHSLEVASFAKSLGQNIGESILTQHQDLDFTPQMKEDICRILECAGLIHDIGNPPFGHFGEEVIRNWFVENLPKLDYFGDTVESMLTPQMLEDFYHFEGNAQALRLVTRLHYLVDENGMNLSYALLNTIVKYPISSVEIRPHSHLHRKMGYYYAERDIFRMVTEATGTNGLRHPLTFILEAADDLAYKTADIEDAFVKGFLSFHDLERELQRLEFEFPDAQFHPLEHLYRLHKTGIQKQVNNPESYAVKNWIVLLQSILIGYATDGFTMHYDEIMQGTFEKDLFEDTYGQYLMELLGDMATRYVFTSNEIYKMEVREAVILNFLMDKMIHAILYYDTPKKLNTIDRRMISFISDNYRKAYQQQAEGKSEEEKLYLRLMLVTDYICGMTDSYANRLYQEMNGMNGLNP